jgi:hypothetical protein
MGGSSSSVRATARYQASEAKWRPSQEGVFLSLQNQRQLANTYLSLKLAPQQPPGGDLNAVKD